MSIKIQNMMSYTLKYDVINKRVKKRGTKTQATIEIENRMYNIKRPIAHFAGWNPP